MATQTTNYHLAKPDITDNVDITVLNGNADIIDTQLKRLSDDKQDELTFDSTPTAGSSNPVTSDGLKQAFDAVQASLVFDNTPTAGSDNPVKSGGIKTYVDNAVASVDVSAQLATKQDVLTWDNTPTSGSDNPVKSGGLYTVKRALENDIADLAADVAAIAAGLIWQASVASFNAIASTYPSPSTNWAVTVQDTGYTYVYNGTAWVLALVNSIDYLTANEARAILEATT